MFSLAELARRMDPLAPPMSLRQLAERHRWLSLPATISFQFLLRRHTHSKTTEHRMLWYNTFLIHGFELTLCNLILLANLAKKAKLDAREAALKLALDPGDVVEALGISDDALVSGLGISLGQLKDAFPSAVDDLLSVVTFGTINVGDILGKVSPRDIVERFDITVEQIIDQLGIDPLQILKAFCDQAIALFESIYEFGLDATFFKTGAAPGRDQRSREIGSMIASDYHIASMCEVFEPEKQENIRTHAAATGRAVQSFVGPGAGSEFAGSGLQTLLLDGRSAVTRQMIFPNQGDRLRDADAWSRKGVMMTAVDVGVGILEIYSTHLFNGGGILEFDGSQAWHTPILGLFPPISKEERLKIQVEQVHAITQFIRDTHQSTHIAMLVGDFNIDANDSTERQALHGALATLSDVVAFADVWPFWSQQARARFVPPRGDSIHPETVCDTPGALFCSESSQPGTTGRIDYCFVQRPHPAHSFVLDLTRLRRRAFQRAPGSFLSDHLGLDFWLVCSPKEHLPA